MTRDLNQIFGVDPKKPKADFIAHPPQMWTPADQAEFLAAIPRIAAQHNVLVVPSGNSVKMEDVGSVALIRGDNGKWLACISNDDGAAIAASYRIPGDAVDTVAAWAKCWTETVQRNPRERWAEMSELVQIGEVAFAVTPPMMRKIDTITVGQRVKVLQKTYSEYKVLPGIVVGFEPFKNLPTAIIACADITWSSVDLKFIQFNAQSKDIEIVAALDGDRELDKAKALDWFDKEIEKTARQLGDLKAKREYFEQEFAAKWDVGTLTLPAAL